MCTVRGREQLQLMINTILYKPKLGDLVHFLDLRVLRFDLHRRLGTAGTLQRTTKADTIVEKSLLVQAGEDTWAYFANRHMSTWALIAILLCLVPNLTDLKLPRINPSNKVGQPEALDFLLFIDKVWKAQKSDQIPLKALSALERIFIQTDWDDCHGKTRVEQYPFNQLKSVTTVQGGVACCRDVTGKLYAQLDQRQCPTCRKL